MVLILTKSYNRYLKAHILETFIIFGCIGARMIDVLYANVLALFPGPWRLLYSYQFP